MVLPLISNICMCVCVFVFVDHLTFEQDLGSSPWPDLTQHFSGADPQPRLEETNVPLTPVHAVPPSP